MLVMVMTMVMMMMMKIKMMMMIYHCKNGGVAANNEGEGAETSNSVKSEIKWKVKPAILPQKMQYTWLIGCMSLIWWVDTCVLSEQAARDEDTERSAEKKKIKFMKINPPTQQY